MRNSFAQEVTSPLDGYSNRRTKSVFLVAAISLVVIYAVAVAIGQTDAFSLASDQNPNPVPAVSTDVQGMQQVSAAEDGQLATLMPVRDQASALSAGVRKADLKTGAQ